jgi:Flp pilus assembly protein TadB
VDSAGAEAETIAKRVSDAIAAILEQSKSGQVSKTDNALRVRAVRNFDKANRRAIGLIDSAEEALEEERRERQRLADSEERRKDLRLMVETEERMTAVRDRSRRENVLLATTVVCVLATVALLFITALSGEVVILSGSVFSALLSVGGGYLLRAAQESTTSDS